MIVAKFGGTSAKDGQTIEHVINNIILKNRERRVVVFSAPGKLNGGDKVTDLLIQAGQAYHESNQYPTELVDRIYARFLQTADYLGIQQDFLQQSFLSLEDSIRNLVPNQAQHLDGIKPFGEIINAEIVAEALRIRGVNAATYRPERIGMVTNGNFENARLLPASYQNISNALMPVLSTTDQIIVVPGFYGVDKEGRFTTFSRGGSDLTGAILANALKANVCENWTDTDGIRRADPRIVPDAGIIEKMTYREARELAYSGAEVLHRDTLIPLIESGTPLNVRNTFNPANPGTYITVNKQANGHIVEGIAHKEGFTLLHVDRLGMNEEVGYLQKFYGIFADSGISIEHMTTGIDSLTIAVSARELNGKMQGIVDRISSSGLARQHELEFDYNAALVCVVGEGMRYSPGIYKNVGAAVESSGINIITDFQSPRGIILAVKQSDAKKAVVALHNFYFGK